MEHRAINDVIILSVVLEEVKHKNQNLHQRLRTLCASETRRFFVFANEHHKYAHFHPTPSHLTPERSHPGPYVCTTIHRGEDQWGIVLCDIANV